MTDTRKSHTPPPKQVAAMEGAELDYAVAQLTGMLRMMPGSVEFQLGGYSPSTDWWHGGPIIEREGIDLEAPGLANDQWEAYIRNDQAGSWSKFDGPTPLIAAMRCYVASKTPSPVATQEER